MNILQIKTNEENNIDFSLSVSGIQDSEPSVRFVVEGNEYSASYVCTRNGELWNVNIPSMPLVESSGFKVEVVVDGYYFVPVEGQVELISPPKISMGESFSVSKKPSVVAEFAMTTKKEENRLVESIGDPKQLSRSISGTAKVFKNAADVLLEMENPSPAQLEKIIGLVKKSLATVEVHIYA